MDKVLIIDSNSILNRAFYALPLLTNSEGIPTNGIFGYLTMFFKMQEEFNAKYIIATFDRKAKTFRHMEYSDYKAGRKSMPKELFEQLAPLKEILISMNINIFELDGFEADDLIGTISRIFEERGFEPIIVTGDKDALQLCSDVTKVIITKKGISDKEVYDSNKMLEVYGVTPSEFIDVKALMGDKSDNIPGVFGIGEKGAIKLIQEYKSIENIYLNIEEMKEGKIKNNLSEHMDMVFLSKKLCKINREVPIDFNFETLKLYNDFNKDEVIKLFLKYDLKSIINKVNYVDNTSDEIYYIKKLDNRNEIIELVEYIKKNDFYLYLYPKFKFGKINDMSFSEIYLSFDKKCYELSEDLINENFDLLTEIMTSEVKKICFSIKAIYKVMFKRNVIPNNIIFDLEIANYLISSEPCDFLTIVRNYAGVSFEEDNDKLGIFYMDKIYKNLRDLLNQNDIEKLYFGIEHPISLILARIELEGFKVNLETLNELREEFEVSIEKYSEEIYRLADEKFNINSPVQLGKILFEKLDLPVIKKTKRGYSTNAEVLDALLGKHDIIQEIINYRQIAKLQSTYVIGLNEFISSDFKIHTSFNQTITATGRLSSTEPNLQNIPIKNPLGRKIRKIFVPNDCDSVILSADYSQIELRVLAHISEDKNMIEAFRKNLDIHKMTATEIFSVSEDDVTSDMRNKCKAINFGIIYGMSDFSLSQDLKISRKKAKEYMDKYFERYVGVKKYLDEIIEFAKQNGYVTTIFNRKRNIPQIKSSNKILKSLGERLAMNTPIQGSAADIIKIAMIKVFNRLRDEDLKSKIILQVHDELVLNVYKDELNLVSDIVKYEMEKCCENISVPLLVNISYGENWFEAK